MRARARCCGSRRQKCKEALREAIYVTEEPQSSPPPQSIVIGQLPDGSATDPVGQHERAASSETAGGGLQHDGGALSPTGASGVTTKAVENYITVMDVKDSSNGTAILAAIFLFVIPFFFVLSFLDSFDDGGCGLCFGSIGIGTLFASISVTESTKTRKNQENAKLRIIEEAGIQSPPASKVPLYVGGASLAVLVLSGFLSEAFYNYEIEIIYGLMNIFGLLGLLSSGIFYLEVDRRRKKTIAQHVKAIVDRETNKPGN